jgi:uncharacterized integral membrane protein
LILGHAGYHFVKDAQGGNAMSDEVGEHAGAVHRHDVAQVIRWLFIAAIVVGLVLVGMDNRTDVPVGYAIGDAHAPGWIVIIASAVAGMFIGWLLRHRRRV